MNQFCFIIPIREIDFERDYQIFLLMNFIDAKMKLPIIIFILHKILKNESNPFEGARMGDKTR